MGCLCIRDARGSPVNAFQVKPRWPPQGHWLLGGPCAARAVSVDTDSRMQSCSGRDVFPRLTLGVISLQLLHIGLVNVLIQALRRQLSPKATKRPRQPVDKQTLCFAEGCKSKIQLHHSSMMQAGAGSGCWTFLGGNHT